MSELKVSGLTFGQAIEALKIGKKVARSGWNGKGMWLILVDGTKSQKLKEGSPYYNALFGKDQPGESTTECEILPHIDMWTTNSKGRRAMLPGWLASQTDILSNDWRIVE